MVSEGFELHVGRIEEDLAVELKSVCPSIHISGQVIDLEKYYSNCSIALIPEVMGGGFKLEGCRSWYVQKGYFFC